MREIASSSYYMVKVDTANVPVLTPAIEYYFQAEDTSGNIVLKGFAFQPLNRAFEVARQQPVKQEWPSGCEVTLTFVRPQ